MSDAKAAWEQVGSTFSGLGMKLRLHLEQARSDDDAATGRPAEGTGDPTTGETPSGPAYAPPADSSAGAEPGPTAGASEAGGEAASGGGAASGAGGREDVKEALRKLGAALDDAFEALGAAAKDPAVKEDVRQVGQSLSGALSATFADVGDDLRRAFRRTKE